MSNFFSLVYLPNRVCLLLIHLYQRYQRALQRGRTARLIYAARSIFYSIHFARYNIAPVRINISKALQPGWGICRQLSFDKSFLLVKANHDRPRFQMGTLKRIACVMKSPSTAYPRYGKAVSLLDKEKRNEFRRTILLIPDNSQKESPYRWVEQNLSGLFPPAKGNLLRICRVSF